MSVVLEQSSKLFAYRSYPCVHPRRIPYHEGLRAHHPLHVYYYHHHAPHVLVPPLFLQHLPPLFHCEPCSVRVAPSSRHEVLGVSQVVRGDAAATGAGSSSMMTSVGLSGSLSSSCILLSLSLIMGCCWVLSLLLLLSASLLIFTPSYPPEIGLLLLSWMLLAAVSLAVVLVMMMDVSLQTPSSCSPISSSSFTVFCTTRGVELSNLCQASFSAIIAASFFFSSCSISRWFISNCCFFFMR